MTKTKFALPLIAAAGLAFSATPAFAGQDLHDAMAEKAATTETAMAEKDTMTEMASKTLYSGEWTKKSFKSSGTWEVYSEGGKSFVKLSSDFRTRNAPDLKIFLSPLEARELNGRNATQGSVLIAPLTSNAGEQVYEIPEGVDLTAFQTILIHCEQFSKLWSVSSLA